MRVPLAALGLVALAPAAFAADAPLWLREAAAAPTPALKASVRALVLKDEALVLVAEDGAITTTRRRAVRVLTGDGQREARCSIVYPAGTTRVKEMRGFVLWPGGDVAKQGRERVVDLALASGELYNDVRVRVLSAADAARPGAVFGCETVHEDRSVFTQLDWPFQDELPVVSSALSLTLPAGWRATGAVHNHALRDPLVNGLSQRWELRDLPPIESEPARPALSSIAPWLAISVLPPAGVRPGIGRVFTGWPDVALWLSQLADPQTVVSPEIAAKASELTRDAATEYARVRAISRYAQAVKYVSIQTGIGRGGGYRPHSAAEVLARGYGDCKDKANLMRTLLKAVGVEAHPVAVFAGDRQRVREDWPSPQQFNHAILAVRLKEAVDVPAASSLPQLGPVLFFDPTDEHTPLGLLPQHEEGSRALLVSAEHGTLLKLPASPPEMNRVERRLDLVLAQDGTLSGTVIDEAFGHAAASYRRDQEEGAAGDYRRGMEAWVARSGPGARLGGLELAPQPHDAVRLVLDFTTPAYGKLRGNLLVVKARALPGRNRVNLHETSRKYPVVLEAQAFEERMRMKLPEGFVVDEVPRPSQGRSVYGEHSASCRVEDGYLNCRRSMRVSATVIPVEQYAEARGFFAWINDDGEPLVLSRRAGAVRR